MMKDCITSKLRLPDLSRIQINYISDANADLVSFLSDCTPAHLCLLLVNYCAISLVGIKSKFYIKALSEAARRTTKEVYFNWIDFSAEDLQTVVRAASNSERIVFNWCCIHCSSGLDFGTDLSYKTKILSFQKWGGTRKERTTDWKTDPSSFSLVVDVISSSGMRDSLEKLSILNNETLSVSKVQVELNSKGMSHISVVEVNFLPLKL